MCFFINSYFYRPQPSPTLTRPSRGYSVDLYSIEIKQSAAMVSTDRNSSEIYPLESGRQSGYAAMHLPLP